MQCPTNAGVVIQRCHIIPTDDGRSIIGMFAMDAVNAHYDVGIAGQERT